MRLIPFYLLLVIQLFSCGVPESEYNKLVEQNSELISLLDECKNGANKLEAKIDKAYSTGLYFDAKELIFELDKKHPESMRLTEFKKLLPKIDNLIEKQAETFEKQKKEEETKKALGYKVLKPKTKVSFGNLQLNFEKIWKGKRWSFDNYDDRYFYRDAKRGNKHILARVTISSEVNNPQLPPISVYQMKEGVLTYVRTLDYKFRRWKDYGSYLGNYADYGNDFAHTKTISFNCGVELSDSQVKKGTVYVVVEQIGCFHRIDKAYGNPEVEYSKLSYKPKKVLNVSDFDNNYTLLKVL